MKEKLTEQEVLLALELSKIPEAKLTKPQRKLRNSLADRVKLENEDLKRQADEANEQRPEVTRRLKKYLWEDLAEAHSFAVRAVLASDYPVVLNPRTMKSGRLIVDFVHTRESDGCKETQTAPELRLLERILMVHEAIQDGDAEMAALSGMAVAWGLLDNCQPEMAHRATRALNRLHARAPRNKPGLGKRAVLIAFGKGCRDTASVCNFFDEWKGHCLDDQWGGVSLDCDDEIDGWELIDEGGVRRAGDLPRKVIRRSGLPSMVSRAKEWEKKHP